MQSINPPVLWRVFVPADIFYCLVKNVYKKGEFCMKKILIVFGTLTLIPVCSFADSAVKGVNPADNVTKMELLPSLNVMDVDGKPSVTTLGLKYDKELYKAFGINFELPLSHFSGYGISDAGIGDLRVRGRAQYRFGRNVIIGATEFVLPTATSDTLGTRQYTFDPTLAYVYAFSANFFTALVGKQFISLYNLDKEKYQDTNQTQVRLLMGYLSNNGWWAALDPQVWINNEDGRVEYLVEGEVGTMLNRTTGVWTRIGKRITGDWHRNDWSVLLGIRFIPGQKD